MMRSFLMHFWEVAERGTLCDDESLFEQYDEALPEPSEVDAA